MTPPEKRHRRHHPVFPAASRPDAPAFFIIWIIAAALLTVFWSRPLVAGEAAMLLSDRVIDQVTGSSGVVTTTIEFPAFADIPPPELGIDTGYSFWGDKDGIPGLNCPGYIVFQYPRDNFQWQNYRYSFPDEKSAEKFKTALTGTPALPTSTTLIKSNPGADTIFLDDGTAPRVVEVIVTTNRKVNPDLVKQHDGNVIKEKIHFQLTFDEAYYTEEIYQKKRDPLFNRPERTYTYSVNGIAVDYIYEWRQKYYGAVFMESGVGDGSIPHVPEGVSYLKSTVSSGIRIYSPRIALAVGLAPAGNNNFKPRQLQTLGHIDIYGLSVHLDARNPIYLYPHTDNLFECP